MKNQQTKKQYWGLGLENETYLQFEKPYFVTGSFIQDNIGAERYSIDYRKCYLPNVINPVLKKGLIPDYTYQICRMMNSHSLEKLDLNYQHKTLPSIPTEDNTEVQIVENPEFSGKSIMDLFLESQPYNIQSMITQRNKTMGSVHFDGDSIEFVTKYFENRTIADSCKELRATKKLFLDKLNNAGLLEDKLKYPDYNHGFNMFMTNQDQLVLFNNGTYHFHITLPTHTIDSRIEDYDTFEKIHINAIYLLQWIQPLFIATLGSPDIMGVISNLNQLEEKFTLGSMRNAMSRYIGVGTYHQSMPKGKILTYKVDDFRKLLKFSPEENIWWRDQIQSEMSYDLLSDLGLDFNLEKMYQSGFEFRSLDEFPIDYLEEVLLAILLICEHSLHLKNVEWSHDSIDWNNLVFETIKNGYQSKISNQQKQTILETFKIFDLDSVNVESLKEEFDQKVTVEDFFFKILDVLFHHYKDENICLNLMCGYKPDEAPVWNNFNKIQIEKHTEQVASLINS